MTSIALKQFTAPDGSYTWFDVLLEDGDLAADAGLESAIVLSLFLDRQAEADDVTDDNDKRGWWADGIDGDDDRIGSRLWLLQREKTTTEVLRRAEEYAEEALEWLVEDGVAKSVSSTAERVGLGMLQLTVQIQRPDGRRYQNAWEVQLNAL